jgi:hypothetical protein
VWDAVAYRFTRFDSEGGLAGVRTVDLAAIAKVVDPPLYPGTMEPLPDGGLLVRLIDKGSSKTSATKEFSVPSSVFRRRSGALRVSADLSIVDTLMFFGDIEEVGVEAPWGPWAVPPPQARRTWITHRGNPPRICIGDQEAPEIRCFDPEGASTLLRWTSNPTPPTRAELESWREATVLAFGQKISEADALEVLDQVPVPELRPDYSQITLDAAGNLWVELGPGTREASPTVEHLVFDPQGALLGTVALPSLKVLEIGHDYVMGVHYDEYNVEHLRVYEIQKE